MNQPIQLTFRYLESEYMQALRAHYASRLRIKLDILVSISAAGIGFYLLNFSDSTKLGWTILACSLALPLMISVVYFAVPRWAFRREPKFQQEYSLTFSEDGIHFRTEDINSKLKWSLYTRAIVTGNAYLLYYGASGFTIIPRRAFADPPQQEAFERLLGRHILEIVRQK